MEEVPDSNANDPICVVHQSRSDPVVCGKLRGEPTTSHYVVFGLRFVDSPAVHALLLQDISAGKEEKRLIRIRLGVRVYESEIY